MSKPLGKELAVLAYASALFLYVHLFLFIAVFGITVILNQNKGHEFAAFHIRQMFGIGVIAVFLSVFANWVPNGFIAFLLISLMVLLALLGLVSALKNQKNELPVLGAQFQQWFSFIK